MKKCASCTKDLPDAALHCVFCGAKQPPAPAAQPGMAKTVMGYGNNEELNRLREQAAATNAARSNSPSSAPISQPVAAPAPAPRPHSASQPPPAGYAPGNLAPVAGAQARTMFVDGPPPAVGPGPSPLSSGPMPSPQSPGPSMGGPSYGAPSPAYNPQPSPAYNPQPVGPSGYNPQPVPQAAPIPSAAPPYMAPGHNASQAARPIEPWKDTLRTQMFIWGGVLIACFAVPISLSPLAGWWNVVLDGPGTVKLMPLILLAVGLLSVVVGAIPMASGPRGMIAAVLGLAGIFVPVLALGAIPQWPALVAMGGTVLLVSALLMRSEYTESALPRILVTVGALCALVPFVLPQHGRVPLIEMFKMIGVAPGGAKVAILVLLAYVVVLIVTLLAWMPSPARAGAKPLAWTLILFPLVLHGMSIALSGGEGIDFEHALNPLILGWAYGGGAASEAATLSGAFAIGSAYLVITAYGLASVISKKLE